MKVIFLDVDGVLNRLVEGMYIHAECDNEHLIQRLVERFAKFAKEENAEVVISSTWRTIEHFKNNLLNRLKPLGIVPIGETPRLPMPRGYEIAEWIARYEAENNTILDGVCILDDMHSNLMKPLEYWFVRTNNEEGLSEGNLEAAKLVLNQKWHGAHTVGNGAI